MRVASYVLIVVVMWCGAAGAQPRRGPVPRKAPAPSQVPEGKQAEIDKLDQELNALQARNAYFAVVKLARKIYELQKKLSGEKIHAPLARSSGSRVRCRRRGTTGRPSRSIARC